MFKALRRIGDHIEDVVQIVILLPRLIDEARAVVDAVKELISEIQNLRQRQAPPVPTPQIDITSTEQEIIEELRDELERLREEQS